MLPTAGSFLPIVGHDELIIAVDSYLENGTSSNVLLQYGYPIGSWDVSQVTDFSNIFHAERNAKVVTFNDDISQWNTSSAQSMAYMFAGAAMFRQDISSWSTSGVINMTGMCTYSVVLSGLLPHVNIIFPTLHMSAYPFFFPLFLGYIQLQVLISLMVIYHYGIQVPLLI
jgi:Mycoplasma protein of unknown function, DUF285